MFFLSKLLWLVVQPLTMLLVGLAVATCAKSWRWSRFFVALLVFLAFVPVGPYLLHKLERVYPTPLESDLLSIDNESGIAGVIVLGGAIDLETSVKSGQPQLSVAAERFVEGVALARRFPKKPVIFTGGAGAINHPDKTEAEQVKFLMQKLNIDPHRFVFEDKSRSTFENMAELDHSGYKEKGKWILVTSGFHMLRSVKVFQSHGWDVIPYAAGYMEDDDFQWISMPNILGNYLKLSIVVREMIAIMAYKLVGRIS